MCRAGPGKSIYKSLDVRHKYQCQWGIQWGATKWPEVCLGMKLRNLLGPMFSAWGWEWTKVLIQKTGCS